MRSLDQLDNATVFTYDASSNQLSVRDLNNVDADMVYDQLGRNTSRTDTQGDVASTLDDSSGRARGEALSGVNATVNGYGFNAVDTTYDFEERLTQWKRANGSQNQTWNLTAVGDWQSQTVNGTAANRTHGSTHELTAIGANSLSYDAKGNLTQDTSRTPTQNYVWDFDNKMKSADIDGNGSADVSFEYDALGRRVARKVPMRWSSSKSTSRPSATILVEVRRLHPTIVTSGLRTSTS